MKKIASILFLLAFIITSFAQGVKQSPWTTTTNPIAALGGLGALPAIATPGGGQYIFSGLDGSVLFNQNTFQPAGSYIGSSITNNGVIYSFNSLGHFTMTNTSSHAYSIQGTNGHYKSIDQYGNLREWTTNRFTAQTMVGGVSKTLMFSNDMLTIDGILVTTAGVTNNDSRRLTFTNAGNNFTGNYYGASNSVLGGNLPVMAGGVLLVIDTNSNSGPSPIPPMIAMIGNGGRTNVLAELDEHIAGEVNFYMGTHSADNLTGFGNSLIDAWGFNCSSTNAGSSGLTAFEVDGNDPSFEGGRYVFGFTAPQASAWAFTPYTIELRVATNNGSIPSYYSTNRQQKIVWHNNQDTIDWGAGNWTNWFGSRWGSRTHNIFNGDGYKLTNIFSGLISPNGTTLNVSNLNVLGGNTIGGNLTVNGSILPGGVGTGYSINNGGNAILQNVTTDGGNQLDSDTSGAFILSAGNFTGDDSGNVTAASYTGNGSGLTNLVKSFQAGATNVTLIGATSMTVQLKTAMPGTNWIPTLTEKGALIPGFAVTSVTTTSFTTSMTALTFTGTLWWTASMETQ